MTTTPDCDTCPRLSTCMRGVIALQEILCVSDPQDGRKPRSTKGHAPRGPANTGVRVNILNYLREYGPSTRQEIQDALGIAYRPNAYLNRLMASGEIAKEPGADEHTPLYVAVERPQLATGWPVREMSRVAA